MNLARITFLTVLLSFIFSTVGFAWQKQQPAEYPQSQRQVQHTGAIELRSIDLSASLARDLKALEPLTPNFPAFCRQIALALKHAVENSSDIQSLTQNAQHNALQAIQSENDDAEDRDKWITAYNKLIRDVEETVIESGGVDSLVVWKQAYMTAIGAIGNVSDPGTDAQLITNALWSSIGFLAFGLSVILVQALIMYSRKQGWDELAFKSTGLTLLITAGVFALTAGYGKDQVNPLFGLLGALAGYLLGKETTAPERIVEQQDAHPEANSSAETRSSVEGATQPESLSPRRPTKKA